LLVSLPAVSGPIRDLRRKQNGAAVDHDSAVANPSSLNGAAALDEQRKFASSRAQHVT